MKYPFWVGEKLYLRVLSEEDVTDEYVSWLSDRDVTKYMTWRAFPSTPTDIREYIKGKKRGESLFLGMLEKKTDKHIGNINLGPIDWINRRAEVSMMIGNKDYWGKGYMTEAFELVINHAFNTLNLNKLKAGTEADNISAVNLFEKTGWVREGLLKNETFRDGNFHDMVLFARFNEPRER